MRMTLLALTLLCGMTCAAGAGEVYSNGTGGGNWTDVACWRGGKLPAAADMAVISAHDTVNFDGTGEEITCGQLSIDPGGVLNLKAPPEGARVFTVAGSVELFGTLRMDASASPRGKAEFRFAGADKAGRTLRVGKRGSIRILGADGLGYDDLNACVTTKPSADTPEGRQGVIEALDGSAVDLRYAFFQDVTVTATSLDNTGFETGEAANVVGCSFTGQSYVAVLYCDTPRVLQCRFATRPGESVVYGVHAVYCTLPELSGNTIKGNYSYGMYLVHNTDATIADNVSEKSSYAYHVSGANNLVRNNTSRDCTVGMFISSMSGLVQDTTVQRCTWAVQSVLSDVQVMNLRWLDPPEKPTPLYLHGGATTFLNIPFKPEEITFAEKPAKPDAVWSQSMYFLVIAVKGNRTANTRISVRTEGLAADAVDANVRNDTVAVASNGMTPLPQSMQPIIVRGWSISGSGAVVPPSRYVVTAWEAGADANGPRKVLSTTTVQPDATWYRAEPNAAAATLEMTLP